jgi:hypothetical protein
VAEHRRKVGSRPERTVEHQLRGFQIRVTKDRETIRHIGESNRAPQAAQLVLVRTGARDDLRDVVHRAARCGQSVEHEEWQPALGERSLDVSFRSSGVDEEAP